MVTASGEQERRELDRSGYRKFRIRTNATGSRDQLDIDDKPQIINIVYRR
jgi:hypothetical protein